MESENTVAAEMMRKYGKDILDLCAYIPYFSEKGKKDVEQPYDGKYGESKLQFRVFDSTLLSFVKRAQNSALMDKNYLYVYSRNRIKTHADERKFIERATIRDVDALRGIISRYVLEGQRKAVRWGEGVEEKIYLNVLLKLKGFIDFYKKPD
ncbi:MAG: hypothetical protein J6O55_03905 [Lachnospiraceae bacterium]|nr:hypothetical protein [Lachnospiraceae bacterium]